MMKAVARGLTALGIAACVAGSSVAVAQAHPRRQFDIQAHRGGIGLTVESTLASFGKAMELGVTTLELDLQITRDGREVITHDRKLNPAKCRDTAPVTPGDPQFPYAGKYVKDLTFAQARTLDCGSLRQPDFPARSSPRREDDARGVACSRGRTARGNPLQHRDQGGGRRAAGNRAA